MNDLQKTSKNQPTSTVSVPGQEAEAVSPDFDVMQARANVAQRLEHESPEGMSSFSTNDLLYLQRTVGNQAVAKLLGRESTSPASSLSHNTPTPHTSPPPLQRMTVGPADDEYEQEAETISNRIARSSLRGNERVQRADAPGPEVGLEVVILEVRRRIRFVGRKAAVARCQAASAIRWSLNWGPT